MKVTMNSLEVIEACALWLREKHGIEVAAPHQRHSAIGKAKDGIDTFQLDGIEVTFIEAEGIGYRTG